MMNYMNWRTVYVHVYGEQYELVLNIFVSPESEKVAGTINQYAFRSINSLGPEIWFISSDPTSSFFDDKLT